VEQNGPSAFDRELEYSEMQALEYNLDFLRRDLAVMKISEIQIVKVDEVSDEEEKKKAEIAVPGHPTYRLVQ
jgi:leucyl-tRNA synthetase